MTASSARLESGSPALTLRVDGRRPTLQKDETAIRAGLGRFTVDIVSVRDDGRARVVVGRGVGTNPDHATVDVGAVVVLLATAATVDVRTVWRTQAWPLTVAGGQEGADV